MTRVDLVIAEAAIELVPRELWREPDVVSYCRRRKKDVRWTLLDSSYHHRAMRGLSDGHRRGRPDIVHFALLEALGSPLNLSGMLGVHVHTWDNRWIRVNPATRLPRVYDRFKGLIEQLYKEGRVASGDGAVLLEMEESDLRGVLERLGPGTRVLLHESGDDMEAAIGAGSVGVDDMKLIVGGFPHGDFSREVLEAADIRLRVSSHRLDAWVAVSRALCLLERRLLGR
ncbi:MAG: hypothetical protein ABDH63_03965 [Candidatus Caldarchaeales archaeon]